MIRTTANSYEGRNGSRKRLIPTQGTKLRTAYERAITGKPFRLDDITNHPYELARMLGDYNLIVNGLKGRYRCSGVMYRGRTAPITMLYPMIESMMISQLVEILRDI